MKRHWPVFLFLFCWLTVLLVPSLRRMFWIQVLGDSEVQRGEVTLLLESAPARR